MTRFLIAGTHSGCGKTTVTCAVLAALKQRGLRLAAFKCGPDYIDPMFHREVLGVPTHNLDSFFCDDATLLHLLATRSAGCSAALIEGVMGYYDGASGSSYLIAQITDTPSVIVIDCKGMSDSMGAVMQGFLRYREKNQIAGFIFNRLPEKLIPLAKQLCAELDTSYFGCLPRTDLTFESRHLGLVTAGEIGDIRTKLDALGNQAEQYICLDKLLALDPPAIRSDPLRLPFFKEAPVIAVARDRAFCFQYAENLELLEKMGCVLRFFSPLKDAAIPDADGLILCGGYPELHAEALSANLSMRRSIRDAVSGGMPVIAECGGFIYLHTMLKTTQRCEYPMAGVISGTAFPTNRLRRFGYVTLTSERENLLCGAGSQLRAHEFHYWDSDSCGDDFCAEKPDGRNWRCIHANATMYAGFPHIYFYADPDAAVRFVRACIAYGGAE